MVFAGVCVERAPEARLAPRQGAAGVLLAAVREWEDTRASSHCSTAGVLAVPPVTGARHMVSAGVCIERAPGARLAARQCTARVWLAAVREGEDTGASSHCSAGGAVRAWIEEIVRSGHAR